MKLSTALRIGSMTTKQIRGKWSDGGNGRCALGAVAEACGFTDFISGTGWSQKTEREYPELNEIVAYPERSPHLFAVHLMKRPIMMPLATAIVSLNDMDDWSRDKIADWIETLENAREQKGTEVKHAACVQV